MEIVWYGHSCFRFIERGMAAVVTDPFDSDVVGYEPLKLRADIVTVSHDHKDHNNIEAVDGGSTALTAGEPMIINGAGEYEYKGIFVEGILSYHDEKKGAERGQNIIYRITVDDINIVHLGDLGHELDPKQLDRVEGADILLVPVGGKYTINAERAVDVVNAIEPRIVIPMHYKMDGVKIDGLDPVQKFITAIGLKPEYEERLKLSKKDLPAEETQLVILSL